MKLLKYSIILLVCFSIFLIFGCSPTNDSILILDKIIETNVSVANQGIDVSIDGSKIYIVSISDHKINVWDGTSLSDFVSSLTVTTFNSDLLVDSDGNVYTTVGGSSPTIRKWNGLTGAEMWLGGVDITGASLKGLAKATISGTEYIYVVDGKESDGQIHKLNKYTGSTVSSIDVYNYPIDVAVDSSENYYVLSSIHQDPDRDYDLIRLRKYDSTGAIGETSAVLMAGSFYITLASDNHLYINCSNFSVNLNRKIYIYDTNLTYIDEVDFPSQYIGYTGGIASYGEGDDLRIVVMGQEEWGAGPYFDAILFKKP